MPKPPRAAATPADAIAAILSGTPACWTSSPAMVELPDLSDESGRKTIKFDPAILGNVAAAKGWLGIPAARADGKRPRLTPQQRVAKRLTECMQAIASQAVQQARIAGLEDETAMMVAAVDAAQRGLLAGLVAVQGHLVAPPAEAAEEHRKGRSRTADCSSGGKTSKTPAWITHEQAIEADKAVDRMLEEMPAAERAAVKRYDRWEMLVEEIEAKTGVRYKPESAYRRVNEAYKSVQNV